MVTPQDTDAISTENASTVQSALLSTKPFSSPKPSNRDVQSRESCMSETLPEDMQEEPTSGPLSHRSIARSDSASVGLVTPTSVNRGGSRKSGHRPLYSARSGITQFFNDSESAFTTGLSFDIGTVQHTTPGDANDTALMINQLYKIDYGYTPKADEIPQLKLNKYVYEDHMSAEVIDDMCGIAAYRQACLQRDVHPSAIVIAAIRRNPVNLNLSNIYLGPIGAQCLGAAIESQLSKSIETLSLRNCKIGPSGLCHIMKNLLNLPDECLINANYSIPEDEEGEHKHVLTSLDLSGNNLFEVSELLADGTGLPPLVTSEQIAYSNSEFDRISQIFRREEEKCREKIDLSCKVMSEQERKTKEAALQKEKNAKKNEVVDPYLEMIRATALYNYNSNEPRPFNPPKKLTEEEVKKMKAAGVDATAVPPDPTFLDTLEFHQKLNKMHIVISSQLANLVKHMLSGLSLLTTLDLSANSLDDTFLKNTSKHLCTHASLMELRLGQNCITESGIQYFVSELSNSINLERLDLSNNQFGSIGACVLAYGLCKIMARTTLRLTGICLTGNKIGDEAGAFFLGCFMGGCVVSDIMKHGMTVANDFMGTLPPPISPIWRAGAIKAVSGITAIEVAKCGLGVFSCLQLCKSLLSSEVKLKTLDISGNNLNDGPGFYSIVKALTQRKGNCTSEDCHIDKLVISNKVVSMNEVRQFIGADGVTGDITEFEELAGELSSMQGGYIKELIILPY